MTHSFDHLCAWLAARLGRSGTFVGTLACVLLAGAASFVPGWTETVNTAAGAVTGYAGVLLLIILQNSQNREAKANAIKLDELIRVTDRARNDLIGAEEREMEEIVALREAVK